MIEWRKSSYSGGGNTQCVEVAPMAEGVGVRDSKSRESGHLTVPRTAWQAFVRGPLGPRAERRAAD